MVAYHIIKGAQGGRCLDLGANIGIMQRTARTNRQTDDLIVHRHAVRYIVPAIEQPAAMRGEVHLPILAQQPEVGVIGGEQTVTTVEDLLEHGSVSATELLITFSTSRIAAWQAWDSASSAVRPTSSRSRAA